jgi:DNA-binding CsgD family transcriptional regulator
MKPPRDRLTVKERAVAALVWEGHTNREIADVSTPASRS